MAKKRRKKKNTAAVVLICILAVLFLAVCMGTAVLYLQKTKEEREKPDTLISKYMDYILNGEYEKMYEMLDEASKASISKEDFIQRNQRIYEGIGMDNMRIEIIKLNEEQKGQAAVNYRTTMDTVAGEISFENWAVFTEGEGKQYALSWKHGLIFPNLDADDKVSVSTTEAVRGGIYDRNGNLLAGQGTASSVGLVPGKMNADAAQDLETLAGLLETSVESIQNKLDASWVTDDSFVPVKTIEKLYDTEMQALEPGEAAMEKQALLEALTNIPGVMVTDVDSRVYPYGEKVSHLVGYVQKVTAEDLEEHAGEGYDSNSIIGKSGLELLYEKELKGSDGRDISIINSSGEVKETLALIAKQDGQDIKVTVDVNLQSAIYDQFNEDKSCSVAMNPLTGEVLALVSTPSFNSNDFVYGMSQAKWDSLNADEDKPLFNRFRSTWSPGSTFKPVTASIGLLTGAFTAEEDFGHSGLSWQQDPSWGSYYVTTLEEYDPAVLKNALIYSDNIYFAKAALKIGGNTLAQQLTRIGFGESLPFEIGMTASQVSNDGSLSKDILTADTGYGQGELLVNPLHLAAIYTAFSNQGDMVKPSLIYDENAQKQTWISQAFPADVTQTVREGLISAVNDPNATGYGAHRDDITLAGKTGTAEIKASKEDTSGTELGWFSVFTADRDAENPLLIVSMVEDVKDIGGSSYVVNKVKTILDNFL